jgi:hypothetical protein
VWRHRFRRGCARQDQGGRRPRATLQRAGHRGISLVGEIKTALSGALDRGEAKKLSDLVGADAAAMTAENWPA